MRLIFRILVAFLLTFLISMNAQSQTVIEVLVLFSNDATSATNQQDAESYIASTNDSFENSGLNVRVSLVGALHYDHDDQNTLEGDLDIIHPPGGSEPNISISTLRDNYGADLVILIVENGDGNYNGIARVSTVGNYVNSDNAYAVVAKNRAIQLGYFTFTHEIGHLAGMKHHNEFSGYEYRGFETASCDSSEKKLYTIMADITPSHVAEKINRWSDPNEQATLEYGTGGGPGDDDCDSPVDCGKDKILTNSCDVYIGDQNHNTKAGWEENAILVANFRSFDAPTNLTVSTGSGYGEPYLDWDDHQAPNFDYFQVYRRELNVTQFQVIGTTTSSNYSDWTISNKYSQSSEFQYAVKAVNTVGANSSYSNSVLYDGQLMMSKRVNQDNSIPSSFGIENNYPNPFNPTTQITLNLPERANVQISVYNVNGQEVATLINETRNAGSYVVNFEASSLSSGVYIARMTAIGEESGIKFTDQIKMQLIK